MFGGSVKDGLDLDHVVGTQAFHIPDLSMALHKHPSGSDLRSIDHAQDVGVDDGCGGTVIRLMDESMRHVLSRIVDPAIHASPLFDCLIKKMFDL